VVLQADGDAVPGAVQLHAHVVAARVVAAVGHQDQGPVVQGEHGRRGVHVAGPGEQLVAPVGAGGVDLGHLPAGHPADAVEVVHAAVAEDAAGDGHIGRRGRRRVQGGRPHRVQPAQLAAGHGGPGRREGGVEAALVADLDRDAGRLDPPLHLEALGHRAGDRLLAEHGQAGLDRGQDELGVGVGRGRHHDAVDPRGQQRRRAVGRLGVEAGGDLGGDGRDGVGDDQRVDHRQVGEGLGVERADPAQADQAKTHDGEPPFSPARRRRSGPSR
jgi:hypothetical protein